MQLFTSDLDRTLIFSKRTIAKEENERVCIEVLDEFEISYVTLEIQELLQEINRKMQFVPVTTRSKEQYDRITLFQKNIVPEIAIVANGGIILRNGEIDPTWEEYMGQVIADISVPLTDLQQLFSEQLTAPYFISHKVVEQLFLVYIVDVKTANYNEIEQLRQQLNLHGWDSYFHGRKFYILPKQLTKGAAVNYLKEQNLYDMHFAAGDSLMDVSMLHLADYSFTPRNGEIMQHPEIYRDIELIQKEGAAFAEYCLHQILTNK